VPLLSPPPFIPPRDSKGAPSDLRRGWAPERLLAVCRAAHPRKASL